MRKYFLPKKGVRKLAMLVSLWQKLKSQDPELRMEDLTPENAPGSWEMVEKLERQILQADLMVTTGSRGKLVMRSSILRPAPSGHFLI